MLECNAMVLKYGNLIMPLFKASVTAKGTISWRWVYIELCFKIKCIAKPYKIRHYSIYNSGPVVQLVRAPPCHGGGCGFESRQARKN